jgi:hypothetical protein
VSDTDKPEKCKVIVNGLTKLGLDVKNGRRHDTATCPKTNKKTTIPRHKVLNKYTVGSIYDFLVDAGYKPEDIKNAFKWV